MTSIYLDHASTSPLRPEVREAMSVLLDSPLGNPSSPHRWGREARTVLERARETVAALLRCTPPEVFFTRGGTESINLALLGARRGQGDATGAQLLVLRSAIEHSAVREPMEELARGGAQVTVVSVDDGGRVDLEALESALAARGTRPCVASFQMVNQETGILLPVEEIGERCAGAGVPLHVDAVQAAGKLPIDLSDSSASLLSISGHKFGGPRGTAVLFVRKGTDIRPLLHGGGQEKGLRPGTEDVVGAAAFARALEVAVAEIPHESDRLAGLRSELERGLRASISGLRVHGADAPRAPHILSVGIPGIPRDLLPSALDLEGIGASAGSACRSGSTEVSPVMSALYGEAARSFAPLRLSLGWSTTATDIGEAVPLIAATVERIRAAGVGGA